MELDFNYFLKVIGSGYLQLRPSPEDLPRKRRIIQGIANVINHFRFIQIFLSIESGFTGGSLVRQFESCGRSNFAKTA
jgi:hypothetical protein